MKKFITFISFTMFFISGLFAQTTNDLPLASIAGKNGSVISKDTLLAAGKIDCNDSHFIVTSFKLTQNEGTDLVTRTSKSLELTPEMIKSIKDAPSGAKLYFEEIMVTSADGITLRLNPIIFKLE